MVTARPARCAASDTPATTIGTSVPTRASTQARPLLTSSPLSSTASALPWSSSTHAPASRYKEARTPTGVVTSLPTSRRWLRPIGSVRFARLIVAPSRLASTDATVGCGGACLVQAASIIVVVAAHTTSRRVTSRPRPIMSLQFNRSISMATSYCGSSRPSRSRKRRESSSPAILNLLLSSLSSF